MKLLTPNVTKDLKEQEAVRGLLRMEEQKKQEAILRKNLANAEADFKMTLSRNRAQWALEEERHNKRLKEMQKEVDILETKKAQAMIPIEMYEKQAKTFLEQAKGVISSAIRRENEAERLQERLENKLDTLGQKEQDLKALEAKLESRKKGIELQEQQTIDNTKRISSELVALHKLQDALEEDIKKRREELFLWETNLKAKEEKQKRTDKALSELAIQLEDERATLERAFKRLPSDIP